MTNHQPRPTRVLLACSGLDHAMRGFESHARDSFTALSDEPGLEMELVKGSGPRGPRERSVPTLKRSSPLAQVLGRVSGREPFRFEQAEFAFSLQPEIRRLRPDVVYFSEWHTGLVLARLRAATRGKYRLVLCNGTMAVTGFGHLDRVQELTPAALETVLEQGADPERHLMLPLGFPIPSELEVPTAEERRALRERLALPQEREIVVSVAALNRHHKRLDYLIEEVAQVPEPRPFLLLLGQAEAETPGIRRLAAERLGADGHSIRTVPYGEVADHCRTSDTFVLASLGEGLPRALIEALAGGLPCVTHDYGVTRFALGEHGRFGDFSKPGGLAGLIGRPDGSARAPEQARARHRHAYENFGWEQLRPRYVAMLRAAAHDASA